MEPIDVRGRQIQDLLGERYELLGLLGTGGFASVYKVRNRNLERLEALKVLNEKKSESAGFMERFIQEARIVASLEHPAIIRVHDFGNAGDLLWYTMSFIDGPSLALQLDRHGRIHEETVARLAVPLLDALAYAHGRGIVHRDIKPGNVLLDPDGRPFLSDFGIAKVSGGIARTRTGFVLGSPGYLSPEQLRGEAVDGRSDLYSFGITLYEALTDSVPFDSEEPVATAIRRITEEVEPISKRLPTIDSELARIVMKSLARDRSARFADAREMKAAFTAYLARAYPETGAAEPTPATSVLAVSLPEPPPAPVPKPEGTPAGAGATGSIHAPPVRKRARLVSFVLAAVALAALAIIIRTAGKLAAPSAETPQVPEIGSRVPTPAAAGMAGMPTSQSAATSTTAVPEEEPTKTKAPPPKPREAARSAASAPAPDPRIAKYKPDFVEEPLLVPPSELTVTCAGKIVSVKMTVGPDGSLVKVSVISKSGIPACDDVVTAAVREARFRPATAADGTPVEGYFSASVRF